MGKMLVTIAPGGEYSLNPQQFKWIEDNDIYQKCLVAGQQMTAIQKSDEEPETFELFYLNFMVTGFQGIEEAKSNAAEFAKTVLLHMVSLI